MASYDVHRAFENIPQIVGMELTRRGDQWQGGYYLDGNRHPFRRDKLKVRKWNNDIILCEEGGESMFICKWLMTYGGASDYWDAVRILRGQSAPIVYVPKERKVVQEIKYVNKDVLMAAKNWDLRKCNLFNWMAGLFGEEKVRKVWDMYNVTTDRFGQAVFWVMDSEGRICHEKRMAYKEDGHRDRDKGAWRKYTRDKGYIGTGYFGGHLFKEEKFTYVTESEKSAILIYLYYGRPCIAVGGKNALRKDDRSDKLILLPDYDARETWAASGLRVWNWWEKWGIDEIPDHADIGDMIVWKMLNNKR